MRRGLAYSPCHGQNMLSLARLGRAREYPPQPTASHVHGMWERLAWLAESSKPSFLPTPPNQRDFYLALAGARAERGCGEAP